MQVEYLTAVDLIEDGWDKNQLYFVDPQMNENDLMIVKIIDVTKKGYKFKKIWGVTFDTEEDGRIIEIVPHSDKTETNPDVTIIDEMTWYKITNTEAQKIINEAKKNHKAFFQKLINELGWEVDPY